MERPLHDEVMQERNGGEDLLLSTAPQLQGP